MCHRMTPLLFQELQEALAELRLSGHARVRPQSASSQEGRHADAYPGQQVPLIIPNSEGILQASALTWGFPAPGGPESKLVFNTRLDTALSQAGSGRGLWAKPILQGRCLVPVRAFFESWTKTPPQRGAQVRFTLPHHQVFLLAGIYQNERFSVMTCEPNHEVARVHSRMPLVLGPGESRLWLGPDFAQLADRSAIRLDAEPELPPQNAAQTSLPL